MDTKSMDMKEDAQKKNSTTKHKDIIAFRKKCSTEGTGLSHYILISEKAKH